MSCSSGGYELVGDASVYLTAAVGRGGGSECTCTICPAGEIVDVNVPLFFISGTSDFVSHTVMIFFTDLVDLNR